jgi:hypothetical protein
MTPDSIEMLAGLLCHRCGYDLRAHPPDGKCPECGESVAESRRIVAIPRRPAWRDSDPRWRRRMLAGTWILVLLLLMEGLFARGWASNIPVPAVFEFQGMVRMLDQTLFRLPDVHQPLFFCIGVVLLFSKERKERRGRLDWTRRWGVICSYVVSLLCAVPVLYIAALVLAGIASLFMSMPPQHQPAVTDLFVNVSTAYLRYGPYPKDISYVVLVAFSSIAVLLACAPLFDALRSSGPKWVAAVLLTPLALFSLMHLAQAGRYFLGFSGLTLYDVSVHRFYFRPQLLVRYIARDADYWGFWGPSVGRSAVVVEATKWCIVVAIAVWLSIAQFAAWWMGKKASAA